MIKVIAKIDVDPAKIPEFLAIFKANVPHVLAEDGCIEYLPTMDVDSGIPVQNPVSSHVVTIVETWESLDHLRVHLKAPHMVAYKEKTRDMVRGVKLDVLQPA